jgi:hypothetical protein
MKNKETLPTMEECSPQLQDAALQVEALVCQIRDNDTRADVQTEACEKLCLLLGEKKPPGVDFARIIRILACSINSDDKPPRLYEASLCILSHVIDACGEDAPLQQGAMKIILFHLAARPQSTSLVGADYIRVLLKAMEQNQQDTPTLSCAVSTFSLLIPGSESCVSQFLQLDGPKLYVKYLDMHKNEYVMTMSILASIGHLTATADQHMQQAFNTAGCNRAIAAAATLHNNDADPRGVLHYSFLVIKQLLVVPICSDAQTRIVSEGVADAFMTCIQCGKPSMWTVEVLSYALCGHTENMKTIGGRAMRAMVASSFAEMDSGAFDNIWTIMSSFGSIMLQAQLCECLRPFQDGFGLGGGLALMSKALSILESGTVQDTKKKNYDMFINIACAVQRQHTQNQNECGKQGLIPKMLRLMRNHMDDEGIQSIGCVAMYVIGAKHKKNTAIIKAHGGMDFVVRATVTVDEGVPNPRSMRDFAENDRNDDNIGQNSNMVCCCMGCGKTSVDMDGQTLHRCGACTVPTVYCSVECQRMCWNAHKAECRANRKTKM